MKKANDQINSTNSAPLSDAKIAAALANSPWAVMERESRNFTLGEFLEACWAQERCA